jgi:hypothetical protein
LRYTSDPDEKNWPERVHFWREKVRLKADILAIGYTSAVIALVAESLAASGAAERFTLAKGFENSGGASVQK